MFHSVSLFSQAPLARGSRALPNVLLTDGVLADAILNPPCPPTAHQLKEGNGSTKKVCKQVTEKIIY